MITKINHSIVNMIELHNQKPFGLYTELKCCLAWLIIDCAPRSFNVSNLFGIDFLI